MITEDRIKPLEQRVLIRRVLKPEMTSGGVRLPEQSRTISQTGVVAKVAKGVGSVRVGETVIFSMYAAVPCLATEEAGLVIVRAKDILAKIA